jgi:hypothetical protein
MASNGFDSEEIDLLVRELAAKEWVTTTATPAGSPPIAATRNPRPGSRWSNVRITMPAMHTPRFRRRLARRVAVMLGRLPKLPALPALSRLVRMPGPTTSVRMWVGLGAVYSAMLTFWPYQRTYLWGILFYLVSLSLVVVTGVWGARLSWEARLGAAHTVALGTVLWAVRLASTQLLPL